MGILTKNDTSGYVVEGACAKGRGPSRVRGPCAWVPLLRCDLGLALRERERERERERKGGREYRVNQIV